jgi:hypothetical protein
MTDLALDHFSPEAGGDFRRKTISYPALGLQDTQDALVSQPRSGAGALLTFSSSSWRTRFFTSGWRSGAPVPACSASP